VAEPDLVARLRAAGCVYAEEEAALLLSAASGTDELETMVARRVAGEPLEYAVGWAFFDGLRVAVDRGVFVPRQRTSYLVELAAEALAAVTSGPGLVLDLCCGSGAIGLALARRRPGLRVHAVDNDPLAVACAERNLAGAGGVVHLGDLDAPVPLDLRGEVDVIVANVPYVPSAAVAFLPPEARDHEPRDTLDGGPDGLVLLRRVAALAPAWLRPGGSVFSEVSAAQAGTAAAAFRSAGLATQVHHDPDREATVVRGRQSMPSS
jgi:release factor glutamine methyltransferase